MFKIVDNRVWRDGITPGVFDMGIDLYPMLNDSHYKESCISIHLSGTPGAKIGFNTIYTELTIADAGQLERAIGEAIRIAKDGYEEAQHDLHDSSMSDTGGVSASGE